MQPAGRIDPQDWMTQSATREVLAALTADGQKVRFVGGCVRDAAAGRPVKDIDIATPDRPETVMALLERAGLKAVPTGLDHGTVTAVAKHHAIEVTTLREDVEPLGRHARVAFTDDWIADAARRDLTMNAMFLDPDGTLYDPFDGLQDLKAGRVRFVGDPKERIREDYLRLLRFYRFQAHYGRQPPDPEIVAVTGELAEHLARLSGERIRSELMRLLEAPQPAETLAVMQRAGVLSVILPEAEGLGALAKLAEMEEEMAVPDCLRRLSALLPLDTRAAEAVADRLRLSNGETRRLLRLANPPEPLSAGVAADLGDRDLHHAVQRHGHDQARDYLLLAEARSTRDNRMLLARQLAEIASWQPQHFPLSGRDALELGLKPGPRIGRLLREVQSWWEDQDFGPDRDACRRELKRRIEAEEAEEGEDVSP
ncbi:MAG: CCA tRNA nucleotidyltransferase [Rhodovibrionaceae bacterium]|nr:CCA tRNA nucleotidyltransferase [Rhodovibrionaceae bacterium]